MLKIKILTIGKAKEQWLDDALQEYYKRLRPVAQIEILLAKDDQQLLQWAQKESHLICLDAAGDLHDSESFADILKTGLEKGGSKVAFVIGGAEGLPPPLKSRPGAISLSRMTLTHQIARLVLVEQIYRAFEIWKGSGYHK